jgi:hypothetical protein
MMMMTPRSEVEAIDEEEDDLYQDDLYENVNLYEEHELLVAPQPNNHLALEVSEAIPCDFSHFLGSCVPA